MAERWLYKNELARQAGVSSDCLCEWCKECEPQLRDIYPKYKRTTKMLHPKIVAFLKERYVIT